MKDVFRQVYTPVSEQQSALALSIKAKAQELYDLLPMQGQNKGANREISLAMTALEESVMWAVKGITTEGFVVVVPEAPAEAPAEGAPASEAAAS